MTTLDLLELHDHLPRHLRTAIDKYCEVIAIAMNVAVGEQADSTARLVSGYGDAGHCIRST